MRVHAEQEAEIVDVRRKVSEYSEHLREIEAAFNEHAQELGLGVRLDAKDVIASVTRGTGIARVMRFCDREDDSGVLHNAQLMTALDCIGELLTSPRNNGLVLGAMQSGKTTTSLALQFAGPVVYLLTGRPLYPIYLITSQTSQEDQTKHEIMRFLEFYGELAIVTDEERRCTIIQYVKQFRIDPVFQFSPTISAYREHVLKKALPDTFMGPRLDDFIQRRVMGESIKRVADLCRDANGKGFAPLLIIDEPQYGASDRLVKVEDGFERRPCVMLQIFDRIKEALGSDVPDRVFIGLSATPFELHDIEAVWVVPQYLTSTYIGFNYFGGKVIDDQAVVTPPKTISFTKFGEEIGLPFLGNISLSAYDADPEVFDRFAERTGYTGSQNDYRAEVEQTLRAAILYMAKHGRTPNTGICIRLFNNNSRSHQLLQNMRLPRTEIDVIEYFGSDHRGASVKRAIRQRTRRDLPFLIAVTNRARMGDAFPREVEWFLEFSNRAANLNALLQGLLGRACGYFKNSTVVMSDDNIAIVNAYKETTGGYIYATSPHSLIVGPHRRGAPTSLIRIHRGMPDPVVKQFFDDLDEYVVKPHIIQNSARMRTRRATENGFRTGPILRIAKRIGLFEHLEKKEIREKLFPTYPQFQIARADEDVTHARDKNRKLRYFLDKNGDCRFTFREWNNTANHGGVRSRGYGAKDARDRDQAGDTLEPQINMRKFDPVTGEPIDDKRKRGEWMNGEERAVGDWRAEMMTLPLVAPVRELQAGKATYPIKRGVFSTLLNERERELAYADGDED